MRPTCSWIEGTDTETEPKTEFSLATGSGLGSPWLYIGYGGRTFRCDIRNWLTATINQIKATPRPEEPRKAGKRNAKA
jgi:hypothetical protein